MNLDAKAILPELRSGKNIPYQFNS